MLFLQNSLQRLVSVGTIFLLYTSKIAEMNESDTQLFKTSKHFEIGSVEFFLELFKVGEILKKSGNPNFRHQNPRFDSKTVLSFRKPFMWIHTKHSKLQKSFFESSLSVLEIRISFCICVKLIKFLIAKNRYFFDFLFFSIFLK